MTGGLSHEGGIVSRRGDFVMKEGPCHKGGTSS